MRLVDLRRPSPSLTVVLAALLGLMCFGCVDAGPSETDGLSVRSFPGINTWLGRQEDINRNIAMAMSTAKTGDRITVDLYKMSIGSAATGPGGNRCTYDLYRALIDARARGASVTVISEYKQTSSEYGKKFVDGLIKHGVSVYSCDRGCISRDKRAINHFKVYMLEIGGKKTVIQSTANNGLLGCDNMDVAVALDGNHYSEIWDLCSERVELHRQNALYHASTTSIVLPTTTETYSPGEGESLAISIDNDEAAAPGQVIAYLSSPRVTDPDYQLEILEHITPDAECKVHIAMGHWTTTSRGMKMMARLNELSEGGCDIQAMYGGEYNPDLHDAATFPSLHAVETLHAKFIVLSGDYDGERRKLVWVGSANFTHGSGTYDDESILRVEREGVYEHFVAYYESILSS